MSRRFSLLFALVCVWLISRPSSQDLSRAGAPKLLVLIVVDQMRADYIGTFGRRWKDGLNRLIERGAWFEHAAYPYLNTVTCAGHATIATGHYPAAHGIVHNQWFDRTAAKAVSCTEDASASTIRYGGASPAHDGPARLAVPTLAERLRARTPAGRVVTFSMKARSAIMLAGHSAEAVTWFDVPARSWATSSAYGTLVPEIGQYVTDHPVERDFGKSWTPSLPPEAYVYDDAPPGEHAPAFWTTSFPHDLRGRGERPDDTFYAEWDQSPFSDAYLAELAISTVERLRLGRGAGTDLVGISFSALDLVGHDFGPQSREVQDVLQRLDGTIGRVLRELDRIIGPRYIVAFTSDHGASPIPEQAEARGIKAGRNDLGELANRINDALVPFFGAGKHVARLSTTDLAFAPAVADRIRSNAAAMNAVLQTVAATPGYVNAFSADTLSQPDSVKRPETAPAALSYFAGRSGDVLLIPRLYWIPTGQSTTHGSASEYDQRVPLVLFGSGIRPGRYLREVGPVDIAPTLAALAGFVLPDTDGRVLTEALAGRGERHQ